MSVCKDNAKHDPRVSSSYDSQFLRSSDDFARDQYFSTLLTSTLPSCACGSYEKGLTSISTTPIG